MASRRAAGAEHPGIRWGPFTFRVPLYHTRVEWPELLQGIFVAGATGLALVPLLQLPVAKGGFGLEFEVAVACIFVHSVLISSAAILFGEPFAPGWITPALPLVLTVIDSGRYGTSTERFQFMTAASIDFALLLLVLGASGLGGKLMRWIPDALKAGIILGAAIAALYRIFFVKDAPFYVQPVSTLTAIGVCLILMFSLPLQRYKRKRRWLAVLSGLGLLPGLLAAAIVGPLFNEVKYNVEYGWLIPPFAAMFEQVSPFFIGWPNWQLFVDGIPLALMGYVILFGDLVTGTEVLKTALPARPDEKIDVDYGRSHYSISIRNALMAIFAPFFPTQGCLWTGVHVIIVQRWSEGRKAMDSLYSGISSYYVFGIPLLYMVNPLVTGLKPLMDIALALTLGLTAFACGYVAMGIPKTQIEMGVVLLTAFSLAFFSPWIGMTVGIVATITLVGLKSPQSQA